MSTPIPPQPGARYMDTTAAYDLWSEVYDTDGNFLQALDTIELEKMLPLFVSALPPSSAWKLVDLGCGTGRTSEQLLHIANSSIICLDASPRMLQIAKTRLNLHAGNKSLASFAIYDLLSGDLPPESAGAHGVVSTLVLEHVPIADFFGAASRMLRRDGVFLLTNMHSEMGRLSQAGFVDQRTGEKIRPTSYAHTMEDVLAEAARQGFQLVGEVLERGIDEQTSEELGPRAKKWVGVMVWFAMMFRKAV